jgi:hypothetical protein
MEIQIDNSVNRRMAGYICLRYEYENMKHLKIKDR